MHRYILEVALLPTDPIAQIEGTGHIIAKLAHERDTALKELARKETRRIGLEVTPQMCLDAIRGMIADGEA